MQEQVAASRVMYIHGLIRQTATAEQQTVTRRSKRE